MCLSSLFLFLTGWAVSLLTRHRDAQAFLGGDQVVGVLCVLAEIDLHPVDRAGEDAALAVVVVADRGCGVSSDVGGLVRGEDQRHGCLDAALTSLAAVEVERHGAALGGAAAVVGKLHAHLVRSGRNHRAGLDLEALQGEQVVAIDRAPVFEVAVPIMWIALGVAGCGGEPGVPTSDLTGPMDMSASSVRSGAGQRRPPTPDRRRPDRVKRLRPPTDPVRTLIALL